MGNNLVICVLQIIIQKKKMCNSKIICIFAASFVGSTTLFVKHRNISTH